MFELCCYEQNLLNSNAGSVTTKSIRVHPPHSYHLWKELCPTFPTLDSAPQSPRSQIHFHPLPNFVLPGQGTLQSLIPQQSQRDTCLHALLYQEHGTHVCDEY